MSAAYMNRLEIKVLDSDQWRKHSPYYSLNIYKDENVGLVTQDQRSTKKLSHFNHELLITLAVDRI